MIQSVTATAVGAARQSSSTSPSRSNGPVSWATKNSGLPRRTSKSGCATAMHQRLAMCSVSRRRPANLTEREYHGSFGCFQRTACGRLVRAFPTAARVGLAAAGRLARRGGAAAGGRQRRGARRRDERAAAGRRGPHGRRDGVLRPRRAVHHYPRAGRDDAAHRSARLPRHRRHARACGGVRRSRAPDPAVPQHVRRDRAGDAAGAGARAPVGDAYRRDRGAGGGGGHRQRVPRARHAAGRGVHGRFRQPAGGARRGRRTRI